MLKARLKPGQTAMAATGKCIAYLHPSLANRRLVAGRWNTSSAGASLTSKYNLDVDSEEVLNKKIKTITKQKRNIKSLKLRKRGMENSIAALPKEVQARDMHIKELRKIIKKKDQN